MQPMALEKKLLFAVLHFEIARVDHKLPSILKCQIIVDLHHRKLSLQFIVRK